MTAPGLAVDLTAGTVTITNVYDITVDGTVLTLHTAEGNVVIDRRVADRASVLVRDARVREENAAALDGAA